MISWAMKVRWPGKPSSLTDIQISFAPAEEYFLGMPLLHATSATFTTVTSLYILASILDPAEWCLLACAMFTDCEIPLLKV